MEDKVDTMMAVPTSFPASSVGLEIAIATNDGGPFCLCAGCSTYRTCSVRKHACSCTMEYKQDLWT